MSHETKENSNKHTNKRKKEKANKSEIRKKTNMALLVAVADTSAEDRTPHLEHLRVMP